MTALCAAKRLLTTGPIGTYEFVKKGDPPVMGITKLAGVTAEELRRPRRVLPVEKEAEQAPSPA